MNITEIVQSSGWKNFMAKLYGLGASIVIIGALFKIQHWPGASIMLTVGLTTEAVIFFFSAFEPLHEELDWTLVYPELAGMTDPDEMENYKEGLTAGRNDENLDRFDKMIEDSKLKPETFSVLSENLAQLNQTATELSDVSKMSGATREYVNNFQTAAETLNQMTSFYSQSTEALNSSVGNLSQSYQKSADLVEKSSNEIAENVNKTGNQLAITYDKLAESVSSQYSAISEGSQSYGSQLETLNKNLTALNAVYELQLQGTNEHMKETEKLYKGLDEMNSDLKGTVVETKRYREEIAKLGENLSALNNVYGNMLSAMNVVNKK
jgi:gliding motility-associated protein GldL